MLKKHTSQSTSMSPEFMESIFTKKKIQQLCDEEGLVETIPSLKSKSKARQDTLATMRAYAKKEQLTKNDRAILEAIILTDLRPAYVVKDDTYNEVKDTEWLALNKPSTKKRILQAIPSIGRIEVPGNLRIPYAGTGFLVANDIIMTNRHVAEVFSQGLGLNGLRFINGLTAGIDFKEELNTAQEDHVFFDVRDIIMIHPYWDMALLRVTVPDGHMNKTPLNLSLSPFGSLHGKDIAVIGYPAFDPRNDGVTQQKIFKGLYNIKRLQPGRLTGSRAIRSFDYTVRAMNHDASTLGGNSGSAVIDLATGDVVGLHFAGKYLDSNYAVPMSELAKDEYIQKLGLNFNGDLPSAEYDWGPAWDTVNRRFSVSMDQPIKNRPSRSLTKQEQSSVVKCEGRITPEGKLSISIPVEFKIDSDASSQLQNHLTNKPTSLRGGEAKGFFEGFVGTYEERTGYDPGFLGSQVPLPWLSNDLYNRVERNIQATSSRHVLPYTNFSIVMNRDRRLAFYSAVNIDGAQKGTIPPSSQGTSHSWYYDPRISREAQLNNDAYRSTGGVDNPLDRGHIVRRVEPTWGNNQQRIVKAHNDTFHWTNCSPQHSQFNKQGFLWAKIENYYLDKAQDEDMKVSVFSGPVFRDDDPLYMTPAGEQIHVPLSFWKVVAYTLNGNLQARAFLLSQEAQIRNLVESFNDGRYLEYQLPIADLESLIDIFFENQFLDFDLKPFDAFAHQNEFATDRESVVGKKRWKPLIDLKDVF